MILSIIEGCVGQGVFFEGVDISTLSPAEQWDIVRRLLARKDVADKMPMLIEEIARIVEPDDEEFANEPCESCGDWRYTAHYRL